MAIRGRGSGSTRQTSETKQSKAVAAAGMKALAKAKGQPMGTDWARNAIDAAEQKMSFSAAKDRERGRSKLPLKK
ncbi:MAG: hypothetical protein JWR51_4635 [Devosia sp.]|uniref:hypothetical protein n=1 Tax=Devosia sp. TaxID=1871048 RepID=UPI002637911C|nr:hypothetical protein [Devosia sp.]MDB5531532.1 hypothetical protein [Devosia sp.]